MSPFDYNPEAEAYYFDRYVTPEPNSGCWLWTGALRGCGYGQIRRDRQYTGAHRAMWQFRNGAMPQSAEACHSCDTPICVNPDHIWPGTREQNRDDSIRKGRMPASCQIPRYVTIAAAERAAADPSVPIRQAERLIRRAYDKRTKRWIMVRVRQLHAQRNAMSADRAEETPNGARDLLAKTVG